MEKSLKIKSFHLEFVKRCIVRTLYYQGDLTKAYVGCPLNFAKEPELLRKHFPLAKLIFCVRDPVQAMPSFIDLIGTISKAKFDEPFQYRMNLLFKTYTCPLYKRMAKFEGDDETVWLDFENWKNDGAQELEKLWKELQW